MKHNKFLLPIFILVALIQLYVPAKMIFEKEEVLTDGTLYKFETAPVDPNDPFRGKYVALQFVENAINMTTNQNWNEGEEVYVLLTTNSKGFAKPQMVLKEMPTDTDDFLTATVREFKPYSSKKLVLDYPFDRFYMEESKAMDAEVLYRNSRTDSSQTAYALVYIKNGAAVLEDVLINGSSLKDLVGSE